MNTDSQVPKNSIITRNQFRSLTGLSRTSEWRLAREGKLPPLVVVHGRKLGYIEADYNLWLAKNTRQGAL